MARLPASKTSPRAGSRARALTAASSTSSSAATARSISPSRTWETSTGSATGRDLPPHPALSPEGRGKMLIDPGELIGHWGYPAIFVLVLLGSVGIPVPEESILVVGGYLVWRGQLRLPLVIAIGILSATATASSLRPSAWTRCSRLSRVGARPPSSSRGSSRGFACGPGPSRARPACP